MTSVILLSKYLENSGKLIFSAKILFEVFELWMCRYDLGSSRCNHRKDRSENKEKSSHQCRVFESILRAHKNCEGR